MNTLPAPFRNNRPGTYPGGKNGAGVYQTIINQIPPHDIYIEPFVGSGAILRRVRPAARTIAVDRYAEVADKLPAHAEFWNGCGIAYLRNRHWTGREFVYADPPYLLSERRSQSDLYWFEMGNTQHRELLSVILTLPCPVAVSGYASELYDDALADWRRITFTGVTRGGPATEVLWMNYPTPAALHDYRYLGADYRERERIKRKAQRWAAGLARLPALERQAILSEIGQSVPQD